MRTQHHGRWNPAIIQGDLRVLGGTVALFLTGHRLPRDAGHIDLNQKRANLLMGARVIPRWRVEAGKDDGKVRAQGIRDPYLLAIEHVLITLLPCSSLHSGHVRPRIRLGEGVAAYPLARCQFRQVMLLLLICTPFLYAARDEPGMHRQEASHRRIGPSKLFANQRVSYVTEVRAAILFLDSRAQEA